MSDLSSTAVVAIWTVVVIAAYIVGTFPSAVLVARANGVDITTAGSGNPGASNVARVLGWRRGIWVFVLDAAKGALPAAASLLIGAGSNPSIDGRALAYASAAAAVLGHVAPVTRRFRGGKGVATGGGAFAVLSPVVFLVLIITWIVVSRLTHTAAVASVIVVTALPVGVWTMGRRLWEVPATVGICALVLARHTGNIRRLAAGAESRL